jgi:hypothetical protein
VKILDVPHGLFTKSLPFENLGTANLGVMGSNKILKKGQA